MASKTTYRPLGNGTELSAQGRPLMMLEDGWDDVWPPGTHVYVYGSPTTFPDKRVGYLG